MESEIHNFIKVWLSTIASLCYCYFIASQLPKGKLRLFSLLPIFYLFTTIPFILSSFHLGAPTTFYLLWLGNFKLILFSFDLGPLSSNPPKSLLQFISLACLPIKSKQDPSHQTPANTKNNKNPSAKTSKSLGLSPSFFQNLPKSIIFGIKLVILALVVLTYEHKRFLHPFVVYCLYCVNVYLGAELILALTATPVQALGFDIEPQFNEPYLSTSLQDFWSRRWNLMVPSILRPTVYDPTRNVLIPILGKMWALIVAYVATFLVSGLMHEIIYYQLTRARPTWEVTWFFVLQGVCTAAEVAVKRLWLTDGWGLHGAISRALTLGFIGVTGVWLFFPQIIRHGVDEKAIREYPVMIEIS
ncbi:Wax synthase domain [Dillenia turbinata]|uniref:Wax synthase domain n=1 Tax=Dillenia turbinata TaxID=194707 RepID=A0AAN8VRL8_9MAGN